MGRGIVDPPDDFRESNPPSNPELLEYLTDELERSNYSLRSLTKLIVTSKTFARASVHETESTSDLARTALFAGYPIRRMPAEVLLDAVCDLTGVPEEFAEESKDAPRVRRAVQSPYVPKRADFLTSFGKPNRLLVCECERTSEASLAQSLLLVNGETVRNRLSADSNRISCLLSSNAPLETLVEELYLAALSRRPTSIETDPIVQHLTASNNLRASVEDLLWALINSKEFSLIR
jgi:hypothetical protein